MNKRIEQVIVKVWVVAGIAVVGATAGANPLPQTLLGPTIVPAERAMAFQPSAPDVKLLPTTTASRNQPTANGMSQAANAAANQAATLGPTACSACMRSAANHAVTQAANQAANQAATLGPTGVAW